MPWRSSRGRVKRLLADKSFTLMLILGVETSCDDTAAAVLRDGCTILANVVSSQDQVHGPYGGVVPELASRQHIRSILHHRQGRANFLLRKTRQGDASGNQGVMVDIHFAQLCA